jgi:hypothetical protein
MLAARIESQKQRMRILFCETTPNGQVKVVYGAQWLSKNSLYFLL